MSQIEVDRTYPHPPELVWRALTTSELLAQWLMPNDFEPRVGHRFTFRTEPGPGFDGVVRCEVLELLPPGAKEGSEPGPGVLAMTWAGGPIDTVVRFQVVEVEGGTRLAVTQSGFRGPKAWLVSRILKAGNRTLYGKSLPALLARLARGQSPLPQGDGEPHSECMTPAQGVVARLLSAFERKPR